MIYYSLFYNLDGDSLFSIFIILLIWGYFAKTSEANAVLHEVLPNKYFLFYGSQKYRFVFVFVLIISIVLFFYCIYLYNECNSIYYEYSRIEQYENTSYKNMMYDIYNEMSSDFKNITEYIYIIIPVLLITLVWDRYVINLFFNVKKAQLYQ